MPQPIFLHCCLVFDLKKLLLSTDHSVGEFAGLCSFDNACYFAKPFRQHMGITPREYRRVARDAKKV